MFTWPLKSWSGLKLTSYLRAPQRQPPVILDGVDMLSKCRLEGGIDGDGNMRILSFIYAKGADKHPTPSQVQYLPIVVSCPILRLIPSLQGCGILVPATDDRRARVNPSPSIAPRTPPFEYPNTTLTLLKTPSKLPIANNQLS
jgi:hypothetical protein